MIAGAIAVLLASARVIARYRLVACEACFVDSIFKHSLLVVLVGLQLCSAAVILDWAR